MRVAEARGGDCDLKLMRAHFHFPGGPFTFELPRQELAARSLAEVRPVLRQAEDLARSGAWVAGFVCYEAAPALDPALKVRAPGNLPLAWFGVFDGPDASTAISGVVPGARERGEVSWLPSINRAQYDRAVYAILAAIARGDAYQVNYTLRLKSRGIGQVAEDFVWFDGLRRAQAARYAAYLDLGRHRIHSLSPELFFRRDGDLVTTRPMKGTAPRGRWLAEDDRRAEALRQSEKNRAENLMIVDLMRNDLGRIAAPGAVRVESLFDIERYPTVLQMTSTVKARVGPETRLDEIFAALFPCGSVTGAPKVKAMEIIAGLESEPRGLYCGAIGLMKPGGDAVFNVAIRTLVVDSQHGNAALGVGGGIVADSTCADEYEEMMVKSRFLSASRPPFKLLETLRLEDSKYWLLERHLARLAQSATYFGFALDLDECRELLNDEAMKCPNGVWRVRLIVADDGTPGVQPTAMPDPSLVRREGAVATFAMAASPVDSSDVMLFHKTTLREPYERALAEGRAAAGDVFDVLLWNERGELTEFTRGNLVLEIDGRRFTPPVECGLLDGTMRREMFEREEIEERVLRFDDLSAADRVSFINGLRGEIEIQQGGKGLCPEPCLP